MKRQHKYGEEPMDKYQNYIGHCEIDTTLTSEILTAKWHLKSEITPNNKT